MTHGSLGVGVAHPASGYRPPVLLLRAALGALLVRPVALRRGASLSPSTDLAGEWEDHLSAPWASFCDDEAAG